MPREMQRDRENGRKRRYSDVLEDLYRGPQDFMEAGVRGFLITSLPDREEHSIDETVKVLRKTCVKLYGGIKPLKREDASFAKGYIMVDFMNPETVVCLPNPDAEKAAEEEKAKEEAAAKEAKDNEEMEQENKQEEDAKPEEDAGAEKEKAEAGTENATTEEEKEAKAKEEKEKEEKKKKEEARRKRDEDKKPLMLAPYKFKAFRTELRNIMFIKSDIPDPVEVATACFDMMLDRKPLYTDCVNQLLPVQGVCDNDYKQLEIMCRRVLVPYFGEHLEETPSFGLLLINKMCEPGTENLLEVVRSAVWSLNPCAWQCSPWAEPSVVIHIELIGSKIILSAMPHYMKYRQYSPFAVHELGAGRPEDEEELLKRQHTDDHNRDRDRGGRGGGDRRRDGRDSGGRGRDRDGKKKHHDKENGEKKEEKKEEEGEESNKDTEKMENTEDNKVQAEEIKGDESTDKAEEEKKEKKETPAEKKSTRARKSKS